MSSKSYWIVVAILLSDFPAQSLALAPIYGLNDVTTVPNEYLVSVRGDDVESVKANMEEIKAHLLSQKAPVQAEGAEMSILNTLQFNKFGVIHVKISNFAVVQNLLANPNVKFIEANRLIKFIEPGAKVEKLKIDEMMEEDTLDEQAMFSGSCVSQSSGPLFWGLSRVSSEDMPEHSNANYTYSAPNCDDVYAYVIDTGVYFDHQDFGNRAQWGYTAPLLGSVEGNGDYNGHGTHVAGTIAGIKVGVAKYSKIIAVKVLDMTGSGYTSDVVAGIQWACNDTQRRRAKGVANLSLGAPGRMETVEQAILDCQASTDLIFVVAAGNSAADACNYSPAGIPSVITVGATDINDTLAYFSNYGSCVDIQAPGVGIYSLCYDDPSFFYVCGYSGTSMAAPHVAGVVAQYLSYTRDVYSQSSIEAWLQWVASNDKLYLPPYALPSTRNSLLFSPCDEQDLLCDPADGNSATRSRGWKVYFGILFSLLIASILMA